MKRFKVLLGATMLLVWLVPVVVAQTEEDIDAKRTTRVTLGSTAGTPGTSVVVPVYFTPAEGLQVGSLKLMVDFVSANLKFSRLDPGITAEMGNVKMNSEAKEGKNEKGVESTTLSITASVP
ncbi:MAG: hypothetical protein HY647_11975, partial [Acidobacteria bacterium]|nr:hypothetical protein [Acidobacteriota bacterium]